MHRSRRHSIEIVMGLVVLVLALVAGVAILVHEGLEGDESVLATRSADAPVDPDPATEPAADDEDEDPGARGEGGDDRPAARPPARQEPTATTAVPASTTTTTSPGPEADRCRQLESTTAWAETGDRETLEAAAGASASYVEVVTNRSDQPCRLETNRCGTTAALRTVEGEDTDAPPVACTADSREVVLAPGAAHREELAVRFPVPPGDYRAHVRGYDGVEVVLPVRLDDRLPACDPTRLSLVEAGGEQRVGQADARERGFELPLVVAGASEDCTIRVVDTRLELAGDNREVDLVDETDRWSASTDGDRAHTRALAPPVELSPGWYDVTVTAVLADGGFLSAPVRLLVE